MNPLFRIDFSISDSLKIARKSVLIYETIIKFLLHFDMYVGKLFSIILRKFINYNVFHDL